MRDTIELARDAGVSLREYYDVTGSTLDVLRRFEALVRADERAAPVQEHDHSDELTIAYMSGVHRGKELAAQRQCSWPTCQSEGYQQLLTEQIKQELVTGAAQRQWVGLTEQEAAECWSTSTVRTWQAIEAKLKEKNNGGSQLRESP
jgi:hypothetical protein